MSSIVPFLRSSRPLRPPLRLYCHWRRFLGWLGNIHPTRLVTLGYLTYMAVGWALLCLPAAQRANDVGSLDNLFTVTSAISTTGLTTVSMADRYTLFGQIVIALLIQLGGIGYMTVGSFIVLARGRPLSEVRSEIGQTVFSLPESFRIDKFILSVVKFTLLIEAVGAVALYAAFCHAGLQRPVWSAVFHSISSFCTAGFGLYNDSFVSHAGDVWINVIIAALSYLGAIGFIVCVDFSRMLRGKVTHMTLTSRIILTATLWLTVCGTALFFVIEPSIRQLPPDQRLLAAFFQCMAAMTTVGFNTVPIGSLCKASILLLTVLMVIGASPSGTGGGLKVTTFSAVVGLMKSALRGSNAVTFWRQTVPTHRVWLACASLGFYLAALTTGVFLLTLTENAPFDAVLFETASALGTVGLSMGITASLTALGKFIVILVMFCGRVGPLTLGVALFRRLRPIPETQEGDLVT